METRNELSSYETEIVKCGTFKGRRCDWKALTSDQKNAHIEAYNNPAATTLTNNGCTRCGGTGRISYYNHIAGGICFQCGGRK